MAICFQRGGPGEDRFAAFFKLASRFFSTPQFLLFEFKLAKLLFNKPVAVATRVDPIKAVCSVAFGEVFYVGLVFF